MTRFFPLIPLMLLLAACGGSGSSGAPVTSNPPPPGNGDVQYNGPAARTSDVTAFKINLWDNMVRADRCGACHGVGGQAPAFVRADDINLAYNAANSVVNLRQPGNSQMVAKIRGGHHCWLGNDSVADQACADQITVWISHWAGQALEGDAGAVEFLPPPIRDPGASRSFPASSTLFGQHLHPLLRDYCGECHVPNAGGTPISPFLGAADEASAYRAAQPSINLDNPAGSRLVTRIGEDAHNCWGDCVTNAAQLRDAITTMAAAIPVTAPDDALVLSKALRLDDGILAASGGRFDTNVIARYEFRSGSGSTAFDTSGVEPPLHLTLSGDVEWVGGWGIRINDGKAQGSTAASRKVQQLITGSGEFSLEAWVIPSTTGQDNAHIISYAAGADARNVTLGQAQSAYTFALRHDNTSANGMPLLDSPAESLQASLQHLVLTFDPVHGRRLYINGQDSGSVDPVTPGPLTAWNDTYALVLGNEASGNRLWQGVIRFVALHSRALNPSQIAQNFSAGVGERFYLLFGISDLIETAESYIGFEVSRFDNYSYLFAEPFFINLNDTAPPATTLQGLRVGINGRDIEVGQTWRTLDTEIGGSGYQGGVQPLSRLGTIIALDIGQEQDEFFLSFERLGNHNHVYSEPAPVPVTRVPAAPQPDIGLRTFDEINATMSVLTGVPPTWGDVPETFALVRQQLPINDGFGGFLTAHQIGVAQLAIEYCNALVEAEVAGDSAITPLFAGLDYQRNAQTITDQEWGELVITPLLNRMLGTGLASQPAHALVSAELERLLLSTADLMPVGAPDGQPDGLARCAGHCPAGQTGIAVKAACAAALGGATMLIK